MQTTGHVGTCDTGTHTCAYACPVNTKACTNGGTTSCIPVGACCKDADCAGTCKTCQVNHQCYAVTNADDPNGRCSGTCDATGLCRSKRGQSCTATAGGCISGLPCSPDGVCCDQSCTASCSACNLPGLVGTCSPVPSGPPYANHAACLGGGTVCGGTCGGRADGACVYPTTTCGAGASCTGSSLVGQSACSGGSCVALAPSTCTNGCNKAGNACRVFTEFRLPTTDCQPGRITTGPDGNLWFTDCNSIGRITTSGVITEFPVPTAQANPYGIVAASDGNLWFTEQGAWKLGRITTAGAITELPQTFPHRPFGIAVSDSGALWFTSINDGHVGTAGLDGVATWFPVPTAASYPFEFARGPDGNMWFTEETSGNIGRITPAGVITEFPVTPGFSSAELRGIVTGADGNLWVSESDDNKVARVTVAGVVTEFPLLTPNAQPDGIALGPDGNVWFTEYFGQRIGRVTPSGTVTEYVIPFGNPTGITTGPDGNIWFLVSGGTNAVCRLSM
jgi:streptogramin lyase